MRYCIDCMDSHVRGKFECVSVAVFLHMVLCVNGHGFVWVHGDQDRSYVCLRREREGEGLIEGG